jgi:hypothetical protein
MRQLPPALGSWRIPLPRFSAILTPLADPFFVAISLLAAKQAVPSDTRLAALVRRAADIQLAELGRGD